MTSTKLVLIFLQCLQLATAYKILLTPFAWSSHVMEFVHIGDVMLKRGHQLHVMITPTYPGLEKLKQTHPQFTYIHHHTPDTDVYGQSAEETKDSMNDLMEAMLKMTVLEDLRYNTEGFIELCSNALSDETMFKRLKAENYDYMILDAMPCGRCLYILAYRLGLRVAAITAIYDPWLIKTPSLPSFVPFQMADKPYTDNMSFKERLVNTLQLIDWSAWPNVWYTKDELVTKYAPELPFRSFSSLMSDTELWLFGGDFVLDLPRPVMPHEVMVGGLSTKPASPLVADLEMFVEAAPTIVMSFGSMAADLPDYIGQKFLKAFEKLHQFNVVWRYPHTQPPVGKHIRLMKWIPQNDLLQHNNTVLFITHCGANSQYEAVYAGVPMLQFPMFGDQPYNAKRSEHKGYGLTLSLKDSTPEEVVAAILTLTSDAKFLRNIKKAQSIFRSRQIRPEQRAADALEEVIAHGNAHLHSYAQTMPWYQYLMLDILLFAHLCIIIILFLLFKIVRFLTGGRSSKEKVA